MAWQGKRPHLGLMSVRPFVCPLSWERPLSRWAWERTLRSQNGDLGPNPSSAASELCRPGRVVSPLCFPVFICKVALTTVPLTYVLLCGLNGYDAKCARERAGHVVDARCMLVESPPSQHLVRADAGLRGLGHGPQTGLVLTGCFPLAGDGTPWQVSAF